ncbi:MAG TPA: diadenylate cyclase [Ktedonobacterales bacterium]|nr:diadenylate cyclase [Ktedonobacterales bacterium]
MPGKTIEQFMWSYQHNFRSDVKRATKRVLECLGRQTDVEVYLVGFRVEEGDYPICVEPEDSYFAPSQFQEVRARGEVLHQEDPHSKIIYSDVRSEAMMHSRLRNAWRAEALREALERHHPTRGVSFFVGKSAQVDSYEVHVAVGVPTVLLANTPTLETREREDTPINSSLVASVLMEILTEARKALRNPVSRVSLYPIDRTAAEMVRSAAREFVKSLVVLSGEIFDTPLYEALNEVSTMLYEQRVGVGHMLLAHRDVSGVNRTFTLGQPVGLGEHRAVRKLLELSRGKELALLTDGQEIYGLGSIGDEYNPASESVFSITVPGQGTWEIYHGEQSLLRAEYGQPKLPYARLEREHFIDIATRVFYDPPTCNAATLWDLAQAAAKAEHGTMLVVSADAANEARRLSAQAIIIEATSVSAVDLSYLTTIDGAILLDPTGTMHAMGVILDGIASRNGDPSRGSRYNSAIRYLDTTEIPTMITLVSEDGMINVLPDLRMRIPRRKIQDLIDNLRGEAEKLGGKNFSFEKFYDYYGHVQSLSFYLSSEQCDVINELCGRVEDWRMNTDQMRVSHPELQPHPDMNDGYFLDES